MQIKRTKRKAKRNGRDQVYGEEGTHKNINKKALICVWGDETMWKRAMPMCYMCIFCTFTYQFLFHHFFFVLPTSLYIEQLLLCSNICAACECGDIQKETDKIYYYASHRIVSSPHMNFVHSIDFSYIIIEIGTPEWNKRKPF